MTSALRAKLYLNKHIGIISLVVYSQQMCMDISDSEKLQHAVLISIVIILRILPLMTGGKIALSEHCLY